MIDDTFFAALKLDALRAKVRGRHDVEHVPGLVLADTAAAFRGVAPGAADDPLLNTYRPDFLKTYTPVLGAGDYACVAKCDWRSVPPHDLSAQGVVAGQDHYYLVLRYSLPVETADQVCVALHENPNGDTWGSFVQLKLLERARNMLTDLGDALVNTFFKETGLARHPIRGRTVATVSNVFSPTVMEGVDDPARGEVRGSSRRRRPPS